MTKPPVPKRKPQVVRYHGREVIDEYSWMRAENWDEVLSDPDALPNDIKRHLKAEGAYAADVLANSQALKDELLSQSAATNPNASTPEPELFAGPFIYGTLDDDETWRVLRRRHDAAEWQSVLILPQDDAPDAFTPSPDHRLIATLTDEEGDESYVLRVHDLSTRRELGDRVEGAAGDLAWSADSGDIYYTALDEHHRPTLVKRHRIGSRSSADATVLAEADPAMEIYLEQPVPGCAIVVETTSHETTEIHVIDATVADAAPVLVAARAPGREHKLQPYGAGAIVLKSDDAAPDGIILLIENPSHPLDAARVVVPAGPIIEDFVALGDWVVTLERRDLLPVLVAHRLGEERELTLVTGTPGSSLELFSPASADGCVLTYSIEGPVTPRRVISFDLSTRRETCLWVDPDGAELDAGVFQLERAAAHASDGTAVPITLLVHRATPRNGTALLWLEAYGAYGDSAEMSYSAVRLAAAARGMIFALAHVRGGGDLGKHWHKAGRHTAKSTSVGDYLACARHLIDQRWTSAGRIIAAGESAGGLVLGMALNRAPDLFLMGHGRVPFVDALNTMLDPTLPLTPGEWPEWGNPAVDAADFDLIREGSPYETVTAQAYPPVIATAGISDQRVGYWEPAKWIARLRAYSTSAAPMLLRVDWSSGHGSGEAASERREEQATAFAFALHLASTGEDVRSTSAT